MTADTERRRELRVLWFARPEGKQTGNDVLAFHGWLELNCPELLNRKGGDSFQNLKSELHGLWKDD